MCITEYDEQETMYAFKEEGRQEGLQTLVNSLKKFIILSVIFPAKFCILPNPLTDKIILLFMGNVYSFFCLFLPFFMWAGWNNVWILTDILLKLCSL